jgi:hypothetical protein
VRWKAAGTSFVVVDASGRHAAGLAAGRLDLTRAAVDTSWIEAVLHRAGYVLLDACNVPRDARPLVVGRALTAVQRLRLHTGRPAWILLEDAQKLLQQPGCDALNWPHHDGHRWPHLTSACGLRT